MFKTENCKKNFDKENWYRKRNNKQNYRERKKWEIKEKKNERELKIARTIVI